MIRDINSAGSSVNRAPADIPKAGKKTSAQAQKPPADSFSKGKEAADADWNKVPSFAQKYFTHGNKVEPLFNEAVADKDKSNEIFSNIEQMIRGAKKSVQVEMFGLDKKSLVDLLIKEAKQGVKVQVIMDPPNEGWEADKKVAIDKLQKNGVKVLMYPAKEAGSPGSKFGSIDHVKMLIVDGNKAVIGGMNWGEHSTNNRDVDVAVEGPAVDKMEWLFREDWIQSGGESKELPWIDKTPPHPEGNSSINLITTDHEGDKDAIGITVNRAIRNAKKSVHCELFVLSAGETIQNLINAHNRGVDVKVLLNPLKIKGFGINEKAAQKLKDAGVPVKWFVPDEKTKSKLHAKMGIIDDDQTILGSSNWSYAGFKVNREADVEILDKKVNSEFDRVFKSDWKAASDEPQYLEEPDENPGG